jgi:4-amino-4-deoxy-L-arabinose transferase-like glycosyltransferase
VDRPVADGSHRSFLHLRYLLRQSLVLTTRPNTQITPRHLTVFQRNAPWLIAIAAVGVLLRTWQLMALGLNSDEAVYAGQAASIAGDASLLPYFPIFRAHPLLFQTFLSIPYQLGTSPLIGRLASVAIGIATILVVYKAGTLLYGRRVGLLSAALIAVMPYHVVVTRQILLDGTLTLFATTSLYFMAKFGQTRQVLWLYASFGAMGLTVLSKESGILFFGAIYVFVALFGNVRIRQLVVAMVVFVAVVLPFPLSVAFSGRSSTGEQYLSWQLFRRANHDWSFYFTEVPPAIGLLVVGLAIYTLYVFRESSTWRETLLIPWILVPLLFYELWPTKGFQYLLPIAVPFAILASRGMISLADRRLPLPRKIRAVDQRRWLAPAVIGAVVLSLLIPSWLQIQPGRADGEFLAGTGGVPGGREAGEWVAENVPEGAQLLAIGPSMANILQFYGKRKTYGLSVSPNPLHRNPVYEPVNNPDLGIRSNDFQYLVWDSYSAGRTEFFSARLLRYVERYSGRVIHTESIPVAAGGGSTVDMPVIVIYEVRP